jgi:hypothetical protein
MIYRGKEVLGSTYVDFMVRPEYAGRGLGGLLLSTLTGEADRDFSISFGFPNPSSIKSAIRQGTSHMGYVPIYWRIESASAALKGFSIRGASLPRPLVKCADAVLEASYALLGSITPGGNRFLVERAERFEGRLGKLASTGRGGKGVYVLRDEPFLHWRFDRHPEIDYSVLFLTDRDRGEEPMGYAALAISELQGFKVGFIADVMVHPLSLKPARCLLSHAARRLRAQGVDLLSCMMTGKNVYTHALTSLGFVRVPHRFLPRGLHHTARPLRPDIDADYLRDPDNWFLTWADTDLV